MAIIEVGSGSYEFVTTGLNLAQALAGVRHVAGRPPEKLDAIEAALDAAV